MRDFKRQVCCGENLDLEPWDESYFTSMMKSSLYDLDPSVRFFWQLEL